MIKKTLFLILYTLFTLNALSQKSFFNGMAIENFDSIPILSQKTVFKYDSIFENTRGDTNKIKVLGEVLYMVINKDLQKNICLHSIKFIEKSLRNKKSIEEKLFLTSYQNFFQINIAADYLLN